MKLGVVIYSNDAETVWNAFRLGKFSLDQGDSVRLFLLGKGVESEELDTDQFNVTEQMNAFASAGGEILACGTCVKLRHDQESEMCPLSTMQDLYEIVRGSDRVVTF